MADPMVFPGTTTLRIGEWSVNQAACELSRDGQTVRLDERAMRLLLSLATRAGEVVSIDELLNQVWPDAIVTQDSVYQGIATLRRSLGDDPKQPSYIATVPRLGYRMIAAVEASASPSKPQDQANSSHQKRWIRAAVLFCAAVVLALAVIQLTRAGRGSSIPPRSVAVLPFLDLTPGMHEGEFADGITEELIDKLSKFSGLRVPSATSSFYLKGKQAPVSELARTLGVAYVLDGSVRKSGEIVRIAARLVRADDGYVIWSETYDRPFRDILAVQDEIAGRVAKALNASVR